jgi:5-oxoprolinase (ATP-hydrolysing) subunit A
MKIAVDLNCDMGESFGAYTSGNDEVLMKYITSANIACGFHGGDFTVMHQTVLLAIRSKVSIGAHPSLPDLQGFGRRPMNVTANEVYEMILYQVGALNAFATANNAALHHIKPHGALYNMAARDRKLADAIVKAALDFNPKLILYGLANSELIEAARNQKLAYCEEVFADRTYQADGSLTPRNQEGALIESTEEAIEQVLRMIESKTVSTRLGSIIPINADTICIHGDGSRAAEFAQAIHQKLKAQGIQLAAPSV